MGDYGYEKLRNNFFGISWFDDDKNLQTIMGCKRKSKYTKIIQ